MESGEKDFKLEIASSVEADEVKDVGNSINARVIGDRLLVMAKKRERVEMAAGCVTTAKERISRMAPCVAGKRSSIYRGVTRY